MRGTRSASTIRGRRLRLATTAAVIAAAAAMLGTADRGDAATACSAPAPAGRIVCITVSDVDGVSPSVATTADGQTVEVQAYQVYEVTIQNGGGNTLTNGSLTLRLTDTIAGQADAQPSTATFVTTGSAPFCSATSTTPNVVTCTVGNLSAGDETAPFLVVYRTSTTPGAVATTADLTTSFKEGANQGANPATFSTSETTSLEPEPQLSLAWAPPGQLTRLGTSPADLQFSTLAFRVPGDRPGFLASLVESDGYVCDPSLTCTSQLVRTQLADAAAGTFSTQNPFTLTLSVSLDLLSGRAAQNVAVSHLKDDGTFEVIRTICAASPPAPTELPCLNAVRDSRARLLVVRVTAWENGWWQM